MHHLNMKMKGKSVEKLTYNLVFHSNNMACRKKGRLGMDPVTYVVIIFYVGSAQFQHILIEKSGYLQKMTWQTTFAIKRLLLYIVNVPTLEIYCVLDTFQKTYRVF